MPGLLSRPQEGTPRSEAWGGGMLLALYPDLGPLHPQLEVSAIAQKSEEGGLDLCHSGFARNILSAGLDPPEISEGTETQASPSGHRSLGVVALEKHTDSQMVLIPEESVWFAAEGQTRAPRKDPPPPPRGQDWPTLPRRSPPTRDSYGTGASSGFGLQVQGR